MEKFQERMVNEYRELYDRVNKVMNKDITEDILLKAGMYEVGNAAMEYKAQVGGQKYTIQIVKYSNRNGCNYSCGVFNENDLLIGLACIQTIDHFNKLMELMNIDFKLK